MLPTLNSDVYTLLVVVLYLSHATVNQCNLTMPGFNCSDIVSLKELLFFI